MRLEINQFGGMAPLIDPTALADKFAVFAKNVRLDRGVLAPGALKLESVSDYPDNQLAGRGIKAVTKLLSSDTRFAFSDAQSSTAFVSPVAPADTWGRVYFTAPFGPAFTTTDQYSPGQLSINPLGYRLGVPAPSTSARIIEATVEEQFEEGEPDEDGNVESIFIEPDKVSVAYSYSFVDTYGHESSLSAPSAAVEITYNRNNSVWVGIDAPLPARVSFAGGFRRIYRATFDGSSSQWQYLGDVSVSETGFVDEIPLGQEGEVAVSESWLPAPESLQGLCLVSSSFAAGFFDHYVCYSESRLPHAWPAELQYPVKYAPVELMPMLNGLLVATTGRPYWVEGVDPYSAIPRELPVNAPCVSGGSLVDMGDYAMYVSFEGLVAVGPSQAEIVTESIIDRAGMESLVDATCKAFAFGERYVFSTKDGRWMGFVPQAGLVEYDFGYTPAQFSAVSYNVRDNRHYFTLSDGKVRALDVDGVSSNVEWHSKHWRTPPASFSCFRIEADAYPVRVSVRCRYLGRAWQSTPEFVVTSPHLQRLPVMTGGLWQVVIKPPQSGRVYRVVLGQSGEEVS